MSFENWQKFKLKPRIVVVKKIGRDNKILKIATIVELEHT
jgi:hypothetical protein